MVAGLLLLLQQATVATIDGESLRPTDLRATRQADRTVVTLVVDGAERSFTAEDLVEITTGARAVPRPGMPGTVRVTTTAGDILWGRVAEPEGESLRIEGAVSGPASLPFDRLAAIVVPSNERALPADAGPGRAIDRVYLRSGDTDEGSILAVRPTGIEYESSRFRRTMTVGFLELAAVYLTPIGDPPAPPPGVTSQVAFRDGSRVVGTLLGIDATTVRARDLYGQDLSAPREELFAVFFLGGRVAYLSDLVPTRVEENPNFIRLESPSPGDLTIPWQRDRSARGTPLRLRGVEHRKGIGVHAQSLLAFDLAGAYERFEATVGVDDATRGLGAVRFVVRVDGEDRFRSDPPPTGAGPVQAIRVDVRGARTLELAAEFVEERGGAAAYGDWASARLIRPAP